MARVSVIPDPPERVVSRYRLDLTEVEAAYVHEALVGTNPGTLFGAQGTDPVFSALNDVLPTEITNQTWIGGGV